MALLRVLHGMLRIVICGAQTLDEDCLEEVMEIELQIENDEKSIACFTDASFENLDEAPANLPRAVSLREDVAAKLYRADSLERGFQNVMLKAKTFAHKWSQPDVRNVLLVDKPDASTAPEEGLQHACWQLVGRDSSQARFEQLMQRTSRFYQRCSLLQRPEPVQ